MANQTVAVNLIARVQGFVAGMKTAQKATADLHDRLTQTANRQHADQLLNTAMLIGGGLVAAFGVAVGAAARFDKAMSGVGAATGATAGQMDQLREQALAAGAATSFSATQAAAAQTELAKAGLSVADILSGGLKGALDLAAAGQMNVGEAAEIAATAMTQFRLAGTQIPHVADLLAAAAGKAQGEVHDIGEALKMAGLVASQFDISIEETTGTLAAFASAGLIGSDAGTSLKTMLLRLAAPSGEAADLMEELGINAYDASGQFVGLSAFAAQLQTALSGMTAEQRNAAMATIFGADAIRAANVLYREGAKGITDWTKKVNDAGYAADTARKKTDNLVGDLERLRGTIETSLIKAGSGGTAALRAMVQQLDGAVQVLAGMPAGLQTALLWMAGIGGASLLLVGGLGRAVISMRETREALNEMQLSGSKADRAMSAFARTVGKLVAVAATLHTVSAVVGEDVNPQIQGLSNSLAKFADTGQLSGEALRILGKDFEAFRDSMGALDTSWTSDVGNAIAGTVEGLTGLGRVFDSSLYHAQQRIAGLDAALAAMVQSGQGDKAAEVFRKLAEEAKKEGVSLDELKRGLPQYAAALDGANSAQTEAIAKNKEHDRQMDALGDSLGATIDAIGDLKQAWDMLNGAAVEVDEALMNMEEGMDRLRESFKGGANALDLTTAKGRENRKMLIDNSDALRDLLAAKFREGATNEEISATYNQYISQLRRTLTAAGLTKDVIDDLIARYYAFPDDIYTNVSQRGAQAAEQEVASLERRIRSLKDRQVKIAQSGAPDAAAKVRELQREIDRLRSKTIEIRTRYVRDYRDSNGPYKSKPLPERAGGIVAAQRGLITPAHVARDQMIKYAEPPTGGEAFIPRFGGMDRGRAITDVAAGWYGGRVMWGQQPQTSAAPQITAQTVARAVRAALVDMSVEMDGHAVGRLQGRRAGLLGRGG